ncbi:hypothetical protein [Bartonella tribocorum]|uniref:Hypothetical prophage protein n=2 Tax=Bartonella tribocorum TaxID=85701 RepID=A9IPW9_BART1|nr:hypothetical protein [Bartonella tribocorum]CAK00982.1 hypothetical prophage protein [Bartonella tribocorum CIP 105476]CAK01352.1 hypothetical prophage protein [Bartonella tribocorum CIP 105476]CDO48183.1 hypothetical protein BM1374166_00492 [Bartonella tribocorum]CDO48576.1 hypothetical protein BM1374166_00893 [Bartonella tribocorum]
MKLIIHQKWYLQQVKDTFTSLQAPRLNWALRNALNTAAKQVERFTEKQVTDISSAQIKRIRRGVYIKDKATAQFLETDIIGSGTPIPLKFFKARETKRGVTYTLFKKKEILPHGFIMGGSFPKRVELKMGGNVFQRDDGDQFPIAKQEGPSIAKVMSKPEIASAIAQYANERLTKNIQRQLKRQEYAANKKG